MRQAGFTLIELMVSIMVLSVVVGIVFFSFASVTHSAEIVRAHTERTHLKQVLWRHLSTNLAAMYSDAGCQEPSFALRAESGEGMSGGSTTLRFVASLPMDGGRSLPGIYKEVRYELGAPTLGEDDLDSMWGQEEEQPESVLRITERPFVLTDFDATLNPMDQRPIFDQMDRVQQEERVTEIPLQDFTLAFFDGELWEETWDSTEVGTLPWAVRVRANFPRTREQMNDEIQMGINFDEEADLDLTVTLPLGAGVLATWTDLNRARGTILPDDEGLDMVPDEFEGEEEGPPPGGGIGTDGTRRAGSGTGATPGGSF